MPPLCRAPPGQSSGSRQALLPQPGAWPRFRCHLVNVTTRQQRFGFTHLPGPHLTPHRRLFHIAHHDGLQPTQHVVVWSLPPKGDSEGPTVLHLSHSTDSRSVLPTYASKTSVRRSWRTPRRSVVMAGSSIAASGCDAEGGQGSAWVAGVAAQRGGDVDGPARHSTPMTRLRKVTMTCGPPSVRTWEGTVASGDHSNRRPPPESLNAISDARIDCFEHF
jgi:hypothetical protein